MTGCPCMHAAWPTQWKAVVRGRGRQSASNQHHCDEKGKCPESISEGIDRWNDHRTCIWGLLVISSSMRSAFFIAAASAASLAAKQRPASGVETCSQDCPRANCAVAMLMERGTHPRRRGRAKSPIIWGQDRGQELSFCIAGATRSELHCQAMSSSSKFARSKAFPDIICIHIPTPVLSAGQDLLGTRTQFLLLPRGHPMVAGQLAPSRGHRPHSAAHSLARKTCRRCT